MTVWSPPPPPIETSTFTFFAWAAVTIVRTSNVSPRLLPQLLVPLTVAKARSKWVIFVKSIWVDQLAKLPLQLSRYIVALMAGVVMPLPESAAASAATAPSPASWVVAPPAPVSVVVPPPSLDVALPASSLPVGAVSGAAPSLGSVGPEPLEELVPHAGSRGAVMSAKPHTRPERGCMLGCSATRMPFQAGRKCLAIPGCPWRGAARDVARAAQDPCTALPAPPPDERRTSL